MRTAGCGSRRGPAALGLERGRAAQRCTKSTILSLVGPRLTVNDWLPSVVSVTDAWNIGLKHVSENVKITGQKS